MHADQPLNARASPATGGRRWLAGPVLLLLAAIAFSWLFARTAWVSDDAKITFRSVEQLHAGNGPRWNPHERVQAFTHPLWFLLLAAARWVSADSYLNAIALSWLLGLAALLGSRRLFVDPRRWLLAWALLLSSRAFVDFLTSGLENPLVFALLTALVVLLGDRTGQPEAVPATSRVALVTVTVAALLLCRHDLGLLVAPAYLAFLVPRLRAAPRRVLASAAVGMSPLAAWTIFAVVYYGFPFPNTAYAKLAGGIPAGQLWRQGIAYVGNLARWDPLTLVVIAVGTVQALRQLPPWRWWGFGMAAYLGYVLHIGGDFMAGRFFTPVLLIAVFVVATRFPVERWSLEVAGLLLLYVVVLPGSPWTSGRWYRALFDYNDGRESGITDERGYYFKEASLWGHLAGWDRTGPPPDEAVTVAGAVGATGLQAGLDHIVVDENALCDPLLARLPAESPWRIGHFRRALPAGYLESLRSGRNRIVNPYVRALYRELRFVTQGPLWTVERWRAVARLNLRPPRFACGDPPCRELIVYAIPPTAYTPRVWQTRGSLDRVWSTAETVRVEGHLPFPDLEPGQRLLVAVPVAPTSSRLVSPTSTPVGDRRRGAFAVELRFASADEAAVAARDLCIAAESGNSTGALLASDRVVCLALLGRSARPVVPPPAQSSR